MKFVFSLMVLVASTLAHAGMLGGLEGDPRQTVILCERLLNARSSTKLSAEIEREFFERPFMIWTVHDMTKRGMEKMGLEPNSSERALKDLVIIVEHSADGKSIAVKLNRYANHAFKTVQLFEFSEPVLIGHRAVWILDEDRKLSYEELQKKYPETGREDSKVRVGFQTEPDADGVRRYISFEKFSGHGDGVTSAITFGIDVPPAWKQAEKYSTDLAEVTDDFRTPGRNWRRIGVLSFARVD